MTTVIEVNFEKRHRDYSVEDRVRKPIKGLRQKLRIDLRSAGVTGKFRTHHHRRLGLIVEGVSVPDDFLFQGEKVRFIRKEKT